MCMLRGCALMTIVPISFFLTASFFVLLSLRKVTEKWLRVFGHLVVSFLLLAALVIFSGAVSNLTKGFGGMRCPMMQKMKMCGMMQMMDQKNMPEMAMPGKKTLPKE